MPAYLGLDIGTQSAKGLLLDSAGRILEMATRGYGYSSPQPGWFEQDPEEWWRAVADIIRELRDRADKPAVAVGLSGQMHGVVLVDAHARPVRPCIAWPDVRGGAEVDEIRARAPNAVPITGNPIMAGFTAPKLRWLAVHEPESLIRARWLLLPKDYIRLRLTGEPGSEPTDATGTLLYDIGAGGWSAEMFSAVGAPARLGPPLGRTLDVAGHLLSDVAHETGLPPGTPIVTGGSDMAMALLASGLTNEGQVLVLLGTGGQVLAPLMRLRPEALGKIYHFASAEPGRPFAMGALLAAGLAFRWLRDLLGGPSFDRLASEAAASVPGARGLLFMPHLVGAGTPHFDATARGAFVGLALHHTRADLARAVMEGVVFALRESIDALRNLGLHFHEVLAGGGGARSALWLQIMADVFGSPVRRTEIEDVSALGAGYAAALGTGVWKTLPQGSSGTVSEPGEAQERYAERYATYLELYPALSRIGR